jgi:hypothetical protein
MTTPDRDMTTAWNELLDGLRGAAILFKGVAP